MRSAERFSWGGGRGIGGKYEAVEEEVVVEGHGGVVEEGGFVGLAGGFEEEVVRCGVGVERTWMAVGG